MGGLIVVIRISIIRSTVPNPSDLLDKMTTELAQKAGFLCHPRGCGDPVCGLFAMLWIPVSTGMTPLDVVSAQVR